MLSVLPSIAPGGNPQLVEEFEPEILGLQDHLLAMCVHIWKHNKWHRKVITFIYICFIYFAGPKKSRKLLTRFFKGIPSSLLFKASQRFGHWRPSFCPPWWVKESWNYIKQMDMSSQTFKYLRTLPSMLSMLKCVSNVLKATPEMEQTFFQYFKYQHDNLKSASLILLYFLLFKKNNKLSCT